MKNVTKNSTAKDINTKQGDKPQVDQAVANSAATAGHPVVPVSHALHKAVKVAKTSVIAKKKGLLKDELLADQSAQSEGQISGQADTIAPAADTLSAGPVGAVPNELEAAAKALLDLEGALPITALPAGEAAAGAGPVVGGAGVAAGTGALLAGLSAGTLAAIGVVSCCWAPPQAHLAVATVLHR